MDGLSVSKVLNRLVAGGRFAVLLAVFLLAGFAGAQLPAEAAEIQDPVTGPDARFGSAVTDRSEPDIVIEQPEDGDGLILQIEKWEDLQLERDSAEMETETETETETESESESETEKEEDTFFTGEGSVYNLLLIGTDRLDESWNGNSDVMIVATINTAAKKLCLTSFMRDLYADIPGKGVHKLNYAYAAGGPEALVATLESGYDLEIDNYAVVDFETMSELIDIVGGVEITVSDDEVAILNGYLVSMNSEKDFLDKGGTYKLNGMQAVAYMRIRFVGNNDYQRTQRQRDVLQALLNEMKDLDVSELMKLAGSSLLLVEHNIDMFRLLRLVAGLPEYLSYEIEESRIPYDGLFVSQNEMLIPDFEETVKKLHETIYEGTDEEREE